MSDGLEENGCSGTAWSRSGVPICRRFATSILRESGRWHLPSAAAPRTPTTAPASDRSLPSEAGTRRRRPYHEPSRSDCPAAAALFLHEVLDGFDREILGAVYLDTRKRTVGHIVAYVGSLSETVADPRGIYAPALLANAAFVILVHTHARGEPLPSQRDLVFTKQMVAAGKALAIPLLDHLILGEPPRFVSVRELGRMQ